MKVPVAATAALLLLGGALSASVWPTKMGQQSSTNIGAFDGPQSSNVTASAQFTWNNLSSPALPVIDSFGESYVVNGVAPGPSGLQPLMYAFDNTGNLKFNTNDVTVQNPYFVFNVVAGNLVYIGAALPQNSACILASSRTDGSVVWQLDTNGVQVAAFSISPTLTTLYIQLGNSTLLEVDANSGEVQRSVPLYLPARGLPAQRAYLSMSSDGSTLVFNSPRSVIAVDAASLQPLWNVTDVVNLAIYLPVLITSDDSMAIYVSSSNVTAVDLVSGHTVWSRSYPVPKLNGVTSAALHPGGYLLVGLQPTHSSGIVCVFDVTNGNLVSSLPTPTGFGMGEHIVVDGVTGEYVYYTMFDDKDVYILSAPFQQGAIGTAVSNFQIFTDFAPTGMAIGPQPGQILFASYLGLTILA